MDIIKVSSKSVPQKVAGAIANLFREQNSGVESEDNKNKILGMFKF